MFTSKAEVDRHVESCLKKIVCEPERNIRCFAFAKLYYKVGEYEQANRYVSTYLHAKPLSAEGQHLLGKTLEKMGKKEAALEAYRSSLELDPKQNNLLIKVCELLASEEINLDLSGAKYFCEKAQIIDPYNPSVFHLKERLISTESKNPNEVTDLLLKELETRPLCVDIRIRLLRHLIANNKVKEAYKHAYEVEQKYLPTFLNNLNWYETVAEVLVLYQRENSLNESLTWQYWMLLVSVLDKLVALSLDERTINIKNHTECVAALLNFDQNFKIASENLKDCPEKQLLDEFYTHYTGQICLHLITLLYKQAKKDLIKYKEAAHFGVLLLFAAYNFHASDWQAMWIQHCSDSNRQIIQRWHREAAYRCSQIGHMLLSLTKERKTSIVERVSQSLTGLWREQVFKKLFVTREQQSKIKTSYFATTNKLTDISCRLPDLNDLAKFDNIAQLLHPDSLHHYIWIGLNNKLSILNCSPFQGLSYSVKNLNNCAPETLNFLDIQAFVYCAVICAESQIEENKHSVYYNAEKPNVLPASVCELFGTTNQAKWLQAAYRMFTNQYGSNLGELRLSIINGLECVRCVGNHGLDVRVLVKLAKIFADRAILLTKQSEIEFNEARAELYWKAALPLLERYKKQQSISYSNKRLFEYKAKEMNQPELMQYIDDGKLFIGTQMMKKKDYEKALQVFEALKDPYSSFYQAQIYKTMADKETNQVKENVTSEMRSKNIILLTKARDWFYITLDRLRDPNVDRKHPLNEKLGTEIEKIERLLSRIDPDCANRNECDGMSDENVSSIESDNYNTFMHTNYTNGNYARHDNHNIQSTPFRLDLSRREARPSPERLDAQLRQLMASKDATLNHILDQNKFMLDSHKTLVEELKSFREAVGGLTSTVNELKNIKHTVDDLKGIKKSVDELKVAVDELQNFRNVTDMVYELRKEISDLKRDTSKIKTNQLSDEDLYALDDEYGGDYSNVNANVSGLAQPMYPNMGRLPPAANSLSYGHPFYPGIYPPMYPYPALGLTPSGGLSFGPDNSLTDFRAVSGLSQNLNQPLPTQSAYQPPNLATQQLPNLTSQPYVGQSLLTSNALAQPSFTQPLPFQQQPQPMPTIFKESTIPASSKPAPVNVVITSSDPLPTNKVTTTPQILSVVIPPQHIKGNQQKANNFQIPLPANTTVTTPSVLSQSPMPIQTQNILKNVSPPLYSALEEKSPNKNVLGFQIEKTLSQSFNKSMNENDNTFTRNNMSSTSHDEYDPCPDFKPIIPLPDEVPINSGEEDEEVLFSERAKLHRYCDKEWKERGIGELKLLQHKKTKKIRLLMRRDQVHKICANHSITADMSLLPSNRSEKSYIWGANDFSDGELRIEKFCVQFKTPELAKKFYNEFERVKKIAPVDDRNAATSAIRTPKVSESQSIADLGGFKFTSTPTFKPKDDKPAPTTPIISDAAKTSPFASFTFGKDLSADNKPKNIFQTFSLTNTPTKIDQANVESPKPSLFSTPSKESTDGKTTFGSFTSFTLKDTPKDKVNEIVKQTSFVAIDKPGTDKLFTPVQPTVKGELNDSNTAEEFVPTAEFKPVIPLPDLIDVKTGEENAEVLFESKAKLLRFDTALKEWKERGIGQMKVLKDHIIRLLMRREQVLKVCCNHQLLKSMEFTQMKQAANAVSWYAKDFSEGVLSSEMFALRFKTADLLKEFMSVIEKAKNMLDDNNSVKSTDNGGKCDKKIKSADESNAAPTPASGWGDKFKPKSGSWECKNCYIVNDMKRNSCMACETPKNDTVGKNQSDSQFCFGATTAASGFSFGVAPTTAASSTPAATGFGAAFKPKEGTWECDACLVRNDKDKQECVSCGTARDGAVSSTTTESKITGVDLSTGDLKFNFGIPTATAATANTTTTTTFGTLAANTTWANTSLNWECNSCKITNTGFTCSKCKKMKEEAIKPSTDSSNVQGGGGAFSFGIPAAAVTPVKSFEFIPAASDTKGFSFSLSTTPSKNDTQEEIVFGSPHKAGFEFTPRSPRRQSGGQPPEDESENSYYEEEDDNIYFKPVIPLPDKVDVKTGEEDEDILYCQRAKLYRHFDGEWKERGIGDLKILLKTDTQKLRVLMRREQVHKICLNHYLTDDIKYTPKEQKAWMFRVPDFSEGVLEIHNFCVKFKTEEIAQQFKKAVDEALKTISSEMSTDSKVEDDNDVEFVSESKVTPEEEAEAKRLGLPPKFMVYKQMPDCVCDQCKKEDEMFKDKKPQTPKSASNENNETKFVSFETTTSNLTTSTFSTPPSDIKTFSFINKDNQPADTLKSLLLKPSIFGNTQTSTPNANSPTPTSSIFGSKPSSKFSSPATTSTTNIFNTTPSMPASIFSSPAATTTSSIFGGNSSFTSNLFASPAPATTTTTTGSIFGGGTSTFNSNLFGANANTKAVFGTSTGSIFGVNPTTPTNAFSGNLFGSGQKSDKSIFGGAAATADDEPTILPKALEGISFASLASGNDFTTMPKKEATANPFAHMGAGDPVFTSSNKSKAKPKNNAAGDKNQNEGNESDEGGEDETYDPHYEPIVPLPDEIDVKTGEEDEQVIFTNRAKLYRYNDKEWKERGVGNFKILHHPKQGYYRLLLRRELVHKIVLNQVIRSDLNMSPLLTSTNAWMWISLNFYDDKYNKEKLAIRFKLESTANEFKKRIDEILEELKLNESLQSNSVNVEEHTDEEYNEEEEEEDDNDDEEDDDENERDTVFSSDCMISELSSDTWYTLAANAYVQMFYDERIGAPTIRVTSDETCISNTIISKDSVIEMPEENGLECRWTANETEDDDEPYERHLSLTFRDSETANAYFSAFKSLQDE